MIIPPNGFLGFAQSVSAARASITKGMPGSRVGGKTSTRRRGTKKKRAAGLSPVRVTARRTDAARRASRFVKGSVSAKRYMSSLRRRRKKKKK